MTAEPGAPIVRRMSMRTLGTAAVLTALLLGAGCGQAADPADLDSAGDDPAGSASSPPPGWGGCTAEDLAAASAVTGDVATDGGTARVSLVADAPGPCANALVAQVGDAMSGVDVGGLQLDASTAQLVSLTGPGDAGGELLRVDSEGHPRGGFQPHLFTMTADGLVEVLLDGRPLLPYVATDGGAPPMTVTCHEDGGVGLLQASTSKPPGVVLAWDVQLTTYDVVTGEASVTSDRQIRDHAADPTLRQEMPELFDTGVLFADCSTPWGEES